MKQEYKTIINRLRGHLEFWEAQPGNENTAGKIYALRAAIESITAAAEEDKEEETIKFFEVVTDFDHTTDRKEFTNEIQARAVGARLHKNTGGRRVIIYEMRPYNGEFSAYRIVERWGNW